MNYVEIRQRVDFVGPADVGRGGFSMGISRRVRDLGTAQSVVQPPQRGTLAAPSWRVVVATEDTLKYGKQLPANGRFVIN